MDKEEIVVQITVGGIHLFRIQANNPKVMAHELSDSLTYERWCVAGRIGRKDSVHDSDPGNGLDQTCCTNHQLERVDGIQDCRSSA
ncbi:unnamed protein product [Timema podura]|uniref:Uncharacterized protein n=1 Tax=Timema podura TaxID=61482 RepID=A0ABN7NIV4_TIMPD|nr:unnamed protein product [Timema podura]